MPRYGDVANRSRVGQQRTKLKGLSLESLLCSLTPSSQHKHSPAPSRGDTCALS